MANDEKKLTGTTAKEQVPRTIVYTASEVAAILHVNVGYVHRLRRTGLIPFLKLGSYKCRKAALDTFLERYEGMDVDEELKRLEAISSPIM